MSSHDSPFPAPGRSDRWQPLRCGVLNLYRYDYEEFHFADGRLLLRGNNGSGKSRVLALQLPFLLDGEVSPARVEPDGDPHKRIEWNLLMGKYPDRTGYTWIEFGRREADGTPRFLTLGCGLRAVSGHSGLHSRWFFITSQRVGRDLFLQSAHRTPSSREKLEAAIGAAGRVIQKVEDYRRAVDEALFGLGPRFGALIELLLRLRRPQLSRKLDEEELSGALSEALPILPATIITDVAESFSSLQTDRGKLREFVGAREAVDLFLVEYGAYMRMAVRRRAHAVRTTHAAYEAAQRAVRDAERRFTAADSHLASLSTQHAEFEAHLAGEESAERTLRESPEMRTADDVRQAGELADAAAQALSTAKLDEQQALESATKARERDAQATEQAAKVREDVEASLRGADASAVAADLVDEHRRHFPAESTSNSIIPAGTSEEAALRRVLAQRERALEVLSRRETSVASAQAKLDQAEAEQRHAENAASAARESEHQARAALAETAATAQTAYAAWQGAVVRLQPRPIDELVDAFAAWVEQRKGPSPLRTASDEAHRESVSRLASRETERQQAQRAVVAEREALDAQIATLEHGEPPSPPPPPLRRALRKGRPGAPLWKLCDFRASVARDSRPALEAALQASGLLDAWALPDGSLLNETDDTFLVAKSLASVPRHHLGEALAVVCDRADPVTRDLDVSAIERTLSHIGLGAGMSENWVSLDGRWQLGPLVGHASKAAADYIGESTRAEARRRLLVELRTRRQAVADAQAQIDRDLAAIAVSRNEAAAEFATAPSDESMLHAGFGLEAATRAVLETFAASERAARQTEVRRAEHHEIVEARDRDARDLKLAAWLGRLDALARATNHYTTALAALWPTLRHWETVATQLAGLREQTAEAAAAHEKLRLRREQCAAQAEATRQRFETLREMHGETVAVVLKKLQAATAAVQRLKVDLVTNQRQQLAQTEARTQAKADQDAAEQQRIAQETARRGAIENLRRLAEQRLLADADASLRDIDPGEWNPSQAIDLVRQRIDQALADTPDDEPTWQRRQDSIHSHIQELRDRLVIHGHHQPEPHQIEEVVLVRCVFQARPHTMTELRDAFAAEIVERERLLKAKEQEIIENHLLAEAAVELQKLIRAAETWRASANAELEARPTSAGVRFRFQWEADPEVGFADVRPILLRKGELWTPTERAALAAFLQARIAAEQTADESGAWRDHLTRALDYRRWHRFVVERQQDGKWQRLNRATYGTGSGGEKALALTLPRFAAAAAHYRSAAKTAPRLVMLDEAFAGIDPTMRAQCMGVLAQFDLDVVMTSELEWGCYRTVPALAIYHLTTLPGVDAVAATRWVWNGQERRQEDLPLPADAPTDGTSTAVESPSSSLFDAPSG